MSSQSNYDHVPISQTCLVKSLLEDLLAILTSTIDPDYAVKYCKYCNLFTWEMFITSGG